jgi:hypothetical protein
MLTLAVLLVLSVWVTGTAWMASGPLTPRPTATPVLPPADYQPSAAAPEALPDLVVKSIRVSPSSPLVNRQVTVVVTIQNVGTADVEPGNNFFLDFYVNPLTTELKGLRGDYDWDVQGIALSAGAEASFSVPWVFTDTASFNLWAQVDTPTPPELPIGNVQEADEDNNVLGPYYVTARAPHAWVQKDHVDFFRNMASTLDVVPIEGTVGIPENTPGVSLDGDGALTLGIFDQPPWNTWGVSPTLSPAQMIDYNMLEPDIQVNGVISEDQRFPFVYAEGTRVVAVWEDGRNGPIYGKDIFMRWSDDEGETWYPPAPVVELQVNDHYSTAASQNDQKHPAVAISPDGKVVVAWQDHRGDSFDIYVQVFDYSGGTPVPCTKNDCSNPCDLAAEACNIPVSTGANDEDQILPDIDVDEDGNFYVVWQDHRNGNDDIFTVRSYESALPCPTARAGLEYLPEAAGDAARATIEQAYLCWGGDKMVLDFPSTTNQTTPSVSAVEGVKVIDIEYTVDPGPPPELIVTNIELEPVTYVAVTWVDSREGDADIYLTYSDNEGATFAVDQRLNDDKAENSTNGIDQLDPAVAVNQWTKQITLVVPVGEEEAKAEVDLPVTTMHVVWQDFRHSTDEDLRNDPDIYYMPITIEPDANPPHGLVFNLGGQEQVNDNDQRAWQTGPVWQGDPDVAATGSGLTLAESEGYNAFVVWADGRNYGGLLDNRDIYLRLYSNVGAPTEFVGGNNVMVNDHARNHNFDPVAYPSYRVDVPPHARQRRPSIGSTLVADWPTILGGYLYVAWDDDRSANPFVDRNIYLSRSNLLFGGHRRVYGSPSDPAPPDAPGQGERYGSGAFVSSIYDSGSTDSTWYIVDWHAVTEVGTYVTLQTRIGDTVQEVLDGDWYPKRFPYPDDAISIGAPLQGYSAPGQHIENSSGDYFPQGRYIQYRVNMWARDAASDPLTTILYTPFLFDVILHYDAPIAVYLPIVARNMIW